MHVYIYIFFIWLWRDQPALYTDPYENVTKKVSIITMHHRSLQIIQKNVHIWDMGIYTNSTKHRRVSSENINMIETFIDMIFTIKHRLTFVSISFPWK